VFSFKAVGLNVQVDMNHTNKILFSVASWRRELKIQQIYCTTKVFIAPSNRIEFLQSQLQRVR
jgi:hypothetical protein